VCQESDERRGGGRGEESRGLEEEIRGLPLRSLLARRARGRHLLFLVAGGADDQN